MNYPDNELTYYLKDNNEEASDILYDKYKYIIEVVLAKYKRVFLALNIDFDEARQEANLAFSKALYTYEPGKDAILSTFITLVVERRIRSFIRKYETTKSKAFNDAISLDLMLDEIAVEDIIGNIKYEPLKNLEAKDTLEYLSNKVEKVLSKKELEVYNLLMDCNDYIEISKKLNMTPKQVDNTIQRMRTKLKKMI